jgi:hypothetical protein
MTPGYAKTRNELPWLYYPEADRVIINAHNFTPAASPLLTNLVSYWTLDEASGNAVDAVVASANDLTAVNAPGTAAGKINTSRSFTAASSRHFSRASNTLLRLGDIDFTWTAWAYLTSVPGINNAILSRWTNNTGNREALLMYNNLGVFRFILSSNGAGISLQIDASSFGAASLNTWYFVCAWHDAVNNVVGISVNGAANTASYSSGVLLGAADFQIGAFNNANFWDGRIDEVGFWKRVLTADERAELYNGGSGKGYPFT